MPLTTRVTNNYSAWTAGALWALYDGNTKCSAASPDNATEYTTDIKKSFILANPAHESKLTFNVKHFYELPYYGIMECQVVLEKPDATEVTLFSSSGQEATFYDALSVANITTYLNQAGTYYLKLRAHIQSEYYDPVWENNEVHGSTVLLEVDDTKPSKITGVVATPFSTSSIHVSWDVDNEATWYYIYYKKTTDSAWSYTYVSSLWLEAWIEGLESGVWYDIKVAGYNLSGEGPHSDEVEQRTIGTITQNLSDNTIPTENFEKSRVVERIFEEPVGPTESFSTQRLTSTPTSSIILLCGYTGSKIYTFEVGLTPGTYDTPEIHFGYPDKDKILSEIRFGSEADAVHTLLVYVSIDSGATWALIGSDTCGLGKTGFVYPWLTSHKFLIRFSGLGLYLYFYEIYAIPSGWKVRTS